MRSSSNILQFYPSQFWGGGLIKFRVLKRLHRMRFVCRRLMLASVRACLRALARLHLLLSISALYTAPPSSRARARACVRACVLACVRICVRDCASKLLSISTVYPLSLAPRSSRVFQTLRRSFLSPYFAAPSTCYDLFHLQMQTAIISSPLPLPVPLLPPSPLFQPSPSYPSMSTGRLPTPPPPSPLPRRLFASKRHGRQRFSPPLRLRPPPRPQCVCARARACTRVYVRVRAPARPCVCACVRVHSMD